MLKNAGKFTANLPMFAKMTENKIAFQHWSTGQFEHVMPIY